jgi:hypothetical protein
MDFDIPAEIADYLDELDAFIEATSRVVNIRPVADEFSAIRPDGNRTVIRIG